jgi:hypothetical protein
LHPWVHYFCDVAERALSLSLSRKPSREMLKSSWKSVKPLSSRNFGSVQSFLDFYSTFLHFQRSWSSSLNAV